MTAARSQPPVGIRRLGYVIAIVVNVVGLVVVNNILAWGWISFLTDDFALVVPLMSLVMAATIVVNVVYLFTDKRVVRSTTQIGINLISLVATYRIFRVFPFDFGEFDFNWGIVVRVVLILAMVGVGIGVLTEERKLVSGGPKRAPQGSRLKGAR